MKTKNFMQLFFIILLFFSISCKDNVTEKSPNQEPLTYKVIKDTYFSSVYATNDRPINICIPSDYYTLKAPLPVLYLFHGGYGNESDWIEKGKIVSKLTNLYANGEIPPIIVVTPFNVPIFIFGSNCPIGPGQDPFLLEFKDDIIPFIEKNYRVSTLRKDRAIAGISAGGVQTLNLAFIFPEKFSYVYPISAAFWSEPAFATLTSDLYNELLRNPEINNFKKFKILMGESDELFNSAPDYLIRKTLSFLDDHNIQYEYWDAPGKHHWDFFSISFDELIKEVFQENGIK